MGDMRLGDEAKPWFLRHDESKADPTAITLCRRKVCGSHVGPGPWALVSRHIPCPAAIQAPCSHYNSLSDELVQRALWVKQPCVGCSMH